MTYQPPKLSPRIQRLASEGSDGTYRSPFAADCALILGYLNAGYDENYIRRVIEGSGPYYQEVLNRAGQQTAERYFHKVYAKVHRHYEQNPPRRSKAEMSARIAKHLDWLRSLPIWTGRQGGADLTVTTAACEIGMEVGSTTFGFSTRRVGVRIGRTHTTVLRSLKRLEGDWIHKTKDRTEEGSPIYTLLRLSESDGKFPSRTSKGYPVNWGVDSTGACRKQLWLPDGLGPTARRLYELLSLEDGTTNKELVQVTRLSPGTISKNLHKLMDAGLIHKLDGAWLLLPDVDHAEIAAGLGAGEFQAKLEDRYAKEREVFRQWLARAALLRIDPYHRPKTITPRRPGEGVRALASSMDERDRKRQQEYDDIAEQETTFTAPAGPSIREYYGRESA